MIAGNQESLQVESLQIKGKDDEFLNISPDEVKEKYKHITDFSAYGQMKFEDVPENLQYLPSVWNLSYGGNCIKEAGMLRICQLRTLTQMFVNGSNIQVIPPQISQLDKLQILDIANNKFKRVPRQFCQLTKLSTLYLYRETELTEISPQITRLKNLHTIYLNANDKLPKELNRHYCSAPNDVQTLLEDVSKHFRHLDNALSSALCLIWIRKKFRGECGWLGEFPLDIVKEIAKKLYDTRDEDCWDRRHETSENSVNRDKKEEPQDDKDKEPEDGFFSRFKRFLGN